MAAKRTNTKHRSEKTARNCRMCIDILETFQHLGRQMGAGVIKDGHRTHYNVNKATIDSIYYTTLADLHKARAQQAKARAAWATQTQGEYQPKTLAGIFTAPVISRQVLEGFTAGESVVIPKSAKRAASPSMIEALVNKARNAYRAKNDKLAEHLLREASLRQRAMAA